jgi:hypothetical protein
MYIYTYILLPVPKKYWAGCKGLPYVAAQGVRMKTPKLWSLQDMLKDSALKYIELGEKIADLHMVFYMAEEEGKYEPEKRKLSRSEKQKVRDYLVQIWDICEALKLPVSHDLISARMELVGNDDKLPKTLGEYEILVDAVRHEIKNKTFLFVSSHKAKYYENSKLVTGAVVAAFPTAFNELVLAGSCHACDFDTASVMHCMRALEIALGALARDLGVTNTVENWQTLIDQCEAAIRVIQNLPKTDPKKQNLPFYSESAVQFRYFKDAWRNHAAHARISYSEQQANEIMVHVCSFFEILATQLKK